MIRWLTLNEIFNTPQLESNSVLPSHWLGWLCDEFTGRSFCAREPASCLVKELSEIKEACKGAAKAAYFIELRQDQGSLTYNDLARQCEGIDVACTAHEGRLWLDFARQGATETSKQTDPSLHVSRYPARSCHRVLGESCLSHCKAQRAAQTGCERCHERGREAGSQA